MAKETVKVWIDGEVAARLEAARRPGEDIGDVANRLLAEDAGKRELAAIAQLSGPEGERMAQEAMPADADEGDTFSIKTPGGHELTWVKRNGRMRLQGRA